MLETSSWQEPTLFFYSNGKRELYNKLEKED